MKNPADVIQALESNSGRIEKERIIQAAWDAGITEFFHGAQLAYDALRTFGVKKVPLIEDEDNSEDSSFTWERFCSIATQLENRTLTGNEAKAVLLASADIAPVREWNTWYRRILLKDLKCGVSETTINKILEKNGARAKPYIIPVFSCQLAKNGDDHPKKMAGPKLLDVKLDGVRIISILNKNKNTVTQYSRDGRLNENFPAISSALAKLLPVIKESMVFDGEVVSRSFQALMKQLNRKEDVDTADAKLALFDCLPLSDFVAGECNLTQVQRHDALVEFMPLLEQASNGVVYVIPKLVVNLDTAEGQQVFKEFNSETVEAGYEGIMIKDPDATYRTKRTDAWLKMKPFITVDLEVIGVEPGKPESRFVNTLGGLVCRGRDQEREILVNVGSGFSEELRDEIWNNQQSVIGRIVEIKGDALTRSQDSDTYSLRFPVFMQFRGWNPGEKI
jgi:DNA ligase-1